MAPDWNKVENETVARLQTLLRFDTTNPPGNEMPLAVYLQKELEGAGIETVLLEPAPTRAALVARLRGTGNKRPVILLAHMDVVGVERDKWSCDPFAGELRDGYVYGRGAIDDKGMLAANLTAMLELSALVRETGKLLERDVLFVATSDEEAGGDWGMGWIIEHHPELVDAEFALNEGGRTRIVGGGKTYLAVQSAEKVSHVVSVTAAGPAGHAAVPLTDNAIFRLARAVARMADHVEPLQLTTITRRFFGDLAEIWPDPAEGAAMRALVANDPKLRDEGAAKLSKTAVFNAVLRNGISATMLTGGIRYNVIPATAGAAFNVRTLPGESVDDVVSRLRTTIGDSGIDIQVTQRGEEAPASDPDSEMFAAIAESVRAIRPEIAVVPYLSTGVTDSARLRRIGVKAFGILPFPMEQADEERMHGHDERVPVESLHFGTRLIYEATLRVAT
ncbi:MAG: M20/M25/M40 family metallo-hydrolase [Gemmatimonadaceae bacterium]|nr:M20/M25/M40 family metallo-hydrolase [Gemmatimonadaceae bacterium]